MAASSTLNVSRVESRRVKLDDTILVVGAGVFGLTTAYQLSKRGYSKVTVLDRYPPPVPDGSSVDISRVIRPDYADDFYTKLGMEAMKGWEGEYQQFFHKSGLLCASSQGEHPYIRQSKANVEQRGGSVQAFTGQREVRQRFPAINGELESLRGYFNTECGWADAEGSMRSLAHKCALNGVSLMTGPRGTVDSLLVEDDRVTGVKTHTGQTVTCDYLILATGAWTPHLLDMGGVSISNAQPVAFLQLTASEAEAMSANPVVIDLSTGWFVFPPTPNTHILKMARHGYGYEVARARSQGTKASAPELSKNNAAANYLPEDAEKALRDGLALFFPALKDRPFMRRRLCWYTDTRKGDFIVGNHPGFTNLFAATGGSGHAFKFLPVLGSYIVDALEGKASVEQQAKWAWQPNEGPILEGDGSRGGPPRRVLSLHERSRL